LDLHLTNAQSTDEERAAVDSELGAPESSWQGGQRQTTDTRAVFNADNHSRRHRLLPVLHAVQNRIGWISPGALNYVSLRLDVAPAEVHGVASFYGMFSLQPRPPVVARVCDDLACITRGARPYGRRTLSSPARGRAATPQPARNPLLCARSGRRDGGPGRSPHAVARRRHVLVARPAAASHLGESRRGARPRG